MKKYFFITAILGILLACGGGSEKGTDDDSEKYLQTGDQISAAAQKELLTNVSREIQRSGPEGAVDYCRLRAMPLTDSISQLFSADIRRLSDKNRNPDNAIETEADRQAWTQLGEMMADSAISEKHFLTREKDEVVYYKAIPLGMPTCLACHGQKNSDISLATQRVIDEKYPLDKAFGYELGELRGMWKIKMKAAE